MNWCHFCLGASYQRWQICFTCHATQTGSVCWILKSETSSTDPITLNYLAWIFEEYTTNKADFICRSSALYFGSTEFKFLPKQWNLLVLPGECYNSSLKLAKATSFAIISI
jgi:hypothetical protein